MKHDFSELRLDRVTRKFAGAGGKAFNALDELTITVKRGEFIALLGPSGCGKSTALNCIAGLLQLSDGSIWLDDVRIDTLPPEQRGFGLRMRGVPAGETAPRVAKALKMVQLTGQEHKLPGQLSGGQQQRVAIARAIVIEPPLVLMDEPLSNLDAKLRIETRAEIRRIHIELGRATIYVTHDQDEALSLADRIVVMKDGVAQQIASPQDVYLQPSNLHVARFMGYRNVLELDVAGEEGDRVTLSGPGIRLVGTRKLPLSGKRACVAIRPEEAAIGDAGAVNAIAGEVVNVEYGGRDSLVDVRTPAGAVLHVRSAQPLRAGQMTHVQVPVERALVYPVT